MPNTTLLAISGCCATPPRPNRADRTEAAELWSRDPTLLPGRPCGSPPDPQLPRAQLQVQPLWAEVDQPRNSTRLCHNLRAGVSTHRTPNLETPVMGAADQCLLSI